MICMCKAYFITFIEISDISKLLSLTSEITDFNADTIL